MNEELRTSITKAFEYLSNQSIEIPPDLIAKAHTKGIHIKGIDTPEEIQARYRDAVEAALLAYFLSGDTDTLRSDITAAMQSAYTDAGNLNGIGVDSEWLQAQMDNEAANIESLIESAQQMRDAGATPEEIDTWSAARAAGYAGAALFIYNASMLLSNGGNPLTWNLGQTEKHCATCAELNGGSHPSSWYFERNYIPRKPGAAMDCGGWNCDCYFTDQSGNKVSV